MPHFDWHNTPETQTYGFHRTMATINGGNRILVEANSFRWWQTFIICHMPNEVSKLTDIISMVGVVMLRGPTNNLCLC